MSQYELICSINRYHLSRSFFFSFFFFFYSTLVLSVRSSYFNFRFSALLNISFHCHHIIWMVGTFAFISFSCVRVCATNRWYCSKCLLHVWNTKLTRDMYSQKSTNQFVSGRYRTYRELCWLLLVWYAAITTLIK